jgi:hypothetical protein
MEKQDHDIVDGLRQLFRGEVWRLLGSHGGLT